MCFPQWSGRSGRFRWVYRLCVHLPRLAFNCRVFFRHCVMNVFCDPVLIRMHAGCLVVGPLAVTSAVCISVFVCVVVLAKVVIVDVTMLLFCGSSWFSCFLLESRLGSFGSQIDVWCFCRQFRHRPFERHWYLVWPDRRQLKHLFFCANMVRLSFVVFTFEHLSWRCFPSQYMHGFGSNLPFVLKLFGEGCIRRGWVFVSKAPTVDTRTSSTSELVSFSRVSWLFSLVSISWQSAVRKSFREQSARGFVLTVILYNVIVLVISLVVFGLADFHMNLSGLPVFVRHEYCSRSYREIFVIAAHQLRVRWFLKAIPYARWLELVFFRSVLSAFQWLFHSFVMSLVALKSRVLRCWLSILSNSSFCQYCSVHDCCVLHYYNYPKT